MPIRETTFIDRNAGTWRRLEQEIVAPQPDPDVLRNLYASVSDDLSFARTHYPNRSVKAFLNQKAANLALSLYRNQKQGIDFRGFFLQTVPLEMYIQRYALLAAFVVFWGGFLIGWFSSVADPEFSRLMLSSGYVDMTIENIEKGDPMAVYKSGGMISSALGIMGNNLRVAFLCFVSGLVWGAGSLLVCLYNAIMVGSFQQFFFARGVGFESVLTIWAHGTIEISCIIVACGAGLAMARGILWPGTFSRARAFQLSARSGLRIMAGIAPFIVIAGFIEGFITRLTDIPTAIRIVFLLINLAVVLVYFVYLPWRVGRKTGHPDTDYGRLPPDRPLDWKNNEIKPVSEIFFDMFRYFGGRNSGSIVAAYALGFGLTFGITALMSLDYFDESVSFLNNPYSVTGDAQTWLYATPKSLMLLTVLVIMLAMSEFTRRCHLDLPFTEPKTFVRPNARAQADLSPVRQHLTLLIGLAVPWTLLLLACWLHIGFGALVLPLLALWMRGITYRRGNVGSGLDEAVRISIGPFDRLIGLCLMLWATSFALLLLHEQLWVPFVLVLVEVNLPPELWGFPTTITLDRASSTGTLLAIALFSIQTMGLAYSSFRERYEAIGLTQRIESNFV